MYVDLPEPLGVLIVEFVTGFKAVTLVSCSSAQLDMIIRS